MTNLRNPLKSAQSAVNIPLLAAATLAGCADPTDDAPITTTHDSAGITITTIHASPADLPEWRLGEPVAVVSGDGAGGGPYLEEVETALWLSDGSIVVVDAGARRVHVYGPGGSYQRSHGRRGEGPGELGSVRGATVIPGDTVVVYDAANRKLEHYHRRTGYFRTARVPDPGGGAAVYDARAMGSGQYLLHASRYEAESTQHDTPLGAAVKRPRTAVIVPFGNFGGRLGTPVELPGGYTAATSGAEVRMPFSSRPVIHADHERTVLGGGQDFSLMVFRSADTIRRAIRWPAVQERIGAGEVDSLRRMMLGDSPSPQTRDIVATMFDDDLLPPTRPALGDVLVDAAGRVWAARFEPMIGSRDQRLWYVLDPDGRPLARVSMPPRSRITDVADDRALVVTRDSMDVPRVEMRPVERMASPAKRR